MALLIMAPRLYVAMSRDGLFPSALASLTGHTVTGACHRGLAVLASAFVIVGSFEQIVAFFMCTAMGFIALAAAALFVVRRRVADAPAFRVPGQPRGLCCSWRSWSEWWCSWPSTVRCRPSSVSGLSWSVCPRTVYSRDIARRASSEIGGPAFTSRPSV